MDSDVDFASARDAQLRAMRSDRAGQGKLARRRAREILAKAGAGATRTTIEAWAARRYSQMDPARRAALVEFTLEVRDGPAEAPAERRIDRSAIPPRRAERPTDGPVERKETEMAGKRLTEEQRERVRTACRDAFKADPNATPKPVRDKLADEGIHLSYRDFTNRFWYPIRNRVRAEAPERNGKGLTRPLVRRDPAPSPAPEPAARERPLAENGSRPPEPAEVQTQAKPQLPPPAPVFPEGITLVPRLDGTAEIVIKGIFPRRVALRVIAAAADAMSREEAA